MLSRRHFNRLAAGAGLASIAGGLPIGCEAKRPVPTTTAPAAGAKPSRQSVTIGMIAKSQSNPVFQAARKGAESRAAELSAGGPTSIKIDWRTPNDEDAQQQAEFIEQLVASGADAITIACSDA